MTRLLLILVALASLTGCTGASRSTRTLVRTETVEVRVPVRIPCPAPPPVVRPGIALMDLTEASTDGEVARAYLATVVALVAYTQELERLLDSYRGAPAPVPSLIHTP